MKALHFICTVSILVTFGTLAACSSTAVSRPTTEGEKRPLNVVFILADDLGWGELGCYGQEKIRTPNIDRLASQGTRLTQCYSGAPVCAPSRNVLLTGKHLGHVTIRGNKPAENSKGERIEGQHPIPESAFTWAEAFRNAGYATGAMGKWGLGPVGSTGDPNAQGFDHYFGYNCQRVAHSYFPPHLWRNDEKIVINTDPVPGHKKQPDGDVTMAAYRRENYAPALILEEALSFLDHHRDEPFVLYLPFVEPHVAMQPPPELVESYPREWDDREYRGQCGYLPHPRPRAGYAAMVTDLDRHVGAVLRKLDDLGIADETLVVFTSDNGTTHPSGGDEVFGVGGVDSKFFNSTAGLRGFKGSVYEGGLRVPMIARLPGRIPAGAVCSWPTYFPDMFPTLCEAAGLPVPLDLDGQSIFPILLEEPGSEGKLPTMLWIFPEYGGQVAVRHGNWKMVRRGLARKDPGPWELYDLESDPSESTNLATTYPEIVAECAKCLHAYTDENSLFPVKIPEPPGSPR